MQDQGEQETSFIVYYLVINSVINLLKLQVLVHIHEYLMDLEYQDQEQHSMMIHHQIICRHSWKLLRTRRDCCHMIWPDNIAWSQAGLVQESRYHCLGCNFLMTEAISLRYCESHPFDHFKTVS